MRYLCWGSVLAPIVLGAMVRRTPNTESAGAASLISIGLHSVPAQVSTISPPTFTSLKPSESNTESANGPSLMSSIPTLTSIVALPTSTPTTPMESTSTALPTMLSTNLEVNTFITRTRTGNDATITTAPDFDGDVTSWMQAKWHITTYWSCHTFGRTYVDCGWHEPVLPGGTEIAAAPRAMNPKAAAWVAGAAVFLGAWF